MISILRNEVERLRPAHDELAAQMAEFVASGGEIEVAPPTGYKPKPITYSNQMPPAPKPFVRRRVEPIAPPPITPLERQEEERRQRVAKVMELAPTHTQKEVALATGIGRRTLLSMSKEFGFSFKRVHHLPNSSPEHKAAIAKHELILAERIKAYKELGISRRQVCEKLHITNNTLKRLLDEHEIDYPLSRAGGNRCAA
ncbi:hypothetical protein HBO43_18645 [Pseudomonas veronii]|uniref:Uncharacterized protein n=1 Tax=Pseudomonas veronii TaxID=76761 RepID=A0A7Y1F420_PSEVE|nr:hypothetical protein [Pseudomonas veronii]NMX98617.1 hypothetical protein [Pseudomonas veronii]RTY63404.1 hypothetical protein EKA83_33180 [Pseudomonas veronii]